MRDKEFVAQINKDKGKNRSCILPTLSAPQHDTPPSNCIRFFSTYSSSTIFLSFFFPLTISGDEREQGSLLCTTLKTVKSLTLHVNKPGTNEILTELKKVLHHSHRRMQGMLSVKTMLPCGLLTNSACETLTVGGPSCQRCAWLGVLTNVQLYIYWCKSGAECRSQTSLLGVGNFSQGTDVYP